VTEEVVLNPDYAGFRGGRIEIWQDGPYDVAEVGFLVPEEMFNSFREVFDGKSVDGIQIGNVSTWSLGGMR
jgi:hypothetical protein